MRKTVAFILLSSVLLASCGSSEIIEKQIVYRDYVPDLPDEYKDPCELAPLPESDTDEVQAAIFIREQEVYAWTCKNKKDKMTELWLNTQKEINKNRK